MSNTLPWTKKFTFFKPALFAIMLSTAWMSSASALTVGGVQYADVMKVANQDVKLNGAGIRYKAIFSVYSAGLYLTAIKPTAEEVYAAPGPKRILIVMQRNITSEEFGQAFLAGIRKNAERAEKTKLTAQLVKFGELFASIPEMKKGDVLTIDFIPESGTVIQINGKQVTENIPDPLFYTVLLKIWLGKYPADAALKKALLGEVEEQRQL